VEVDPVKVLWALFAAAAVLIVVEFSLGAAHAAKSTSRIRASRRSSRAARSSVCCSTVSTVPRASCTSPARPSFSPSGRTRRFTRTGRKQRIEDALRGGMLRAGRRGGRRGDIPSFLVGPIGS
jgi:hypothetical protein